MSRIFPHRSLLRWYGKNRRDLPWRRHPTPYKTWISEIMLQQTQVDTVVPYFKRFLRRFPNLRALAKAGESRVLASWSGLGYYSRARNLRRAAKIIRAGHGGRIPREKEALLSLPGIGPYTAGAILSIAYGRPEAILDGNVARVLGRFFLERSEKKLWRLSQDVVREAHRLRLSPGDFNQALMELGALLCSPRLPFCRACPLRGGCRAERRGLQKSYPKPEKGKKSVGLLYAVSFLNNRKGKILMRHRGPEEKWLPNLWEFPMIEYNRGLPPLANLSRDFSKKLGIEVRLERILGRFSHSITHHRIEARVVRGTFLSGRAGAAAGLEDSWRCFSAEEAARLPASSLVHKTLSLACRGH